jgi:hypothetical protein
MRRKPWKFPLNVVVKPVRSKYKLLYFEGFKKFSNIQFRENRPVCLEFFHVHLQKYGRRGWVTRRATKFLTRLKRKSYQYNIMRKVCICEITCVNLRILSCVWVIIDGVWVCDWLYWTLIHIIGNYKKLWQFHWLRILKITLSVIRKFSCLH